MRHLRIPNPSVALRRAHVTGDSIRNKIISNTDIPFPRFCVAALVWCTSLLVAGLLEIERVCMG